MKNFWLLIFFLASLVCRSQQTDTTFFQRDTGNCGYHAVFVEKNKTSAYYSKRTDFSFSEFDSVNYKSTIEYLFKDEKPVFPKPKLDKKLPRYWCELYAHQNQYYLYAPSDWGNNGNIIISDSTLSRFNMDGPWPDVLTGAVKKDDRTYVLYQRTVMTASPTDSVTIHIIDWQKQIAVFDFHFPEKKYGMQLMVGAAKARNFPIVVNYSSCKYIEFNFDEIDFDKILALKKWPDSK